MSKITKKQKEVLSKIGKIGGKARFKKIGKAGMSEMGKKGAKSRWGKKLSTYFI